MLKIEALCIYVGTRMLGSTLRISYAARRMCVDIAEIIVKGRCSGRAEITSPVVSFCVPNSSFWRIGSYTERLMELINSLIVLC